MQSEHDIYYAIYKTIMQIENMNLGAVRVVKLKTAIAELGSNILKYAKTGLIAVYMLEEEKKGICVVASDEGPGIEDIDVALKDHYSTSGTLGLGLPGVRRLVDKFDISSELGKGTEVTITLFEK